MEGTIWGSSAVSLIIWDAGLVVLLSGFIIVLIAQFRFSDQLIRTAGLLTFTGGLLFGLAGILQYGLFFHGPSGLSIPLGIPVILVIGSFMSSERFRDLILQSSMSGEDFSSLEHPDGDQKINKEDFSRIEILSLIFVALVIFQIVYLFTITLNIKPIHYDTELYMHYGYSQLAGKIPYIDYRVVYPPLFFIPVYIAMISTLFSNNYWSFYSAFIMIMMILNISTLFLIYQITRKVFGKKRGFHSCLLYATAFSSAYFTFLTYDIFPTFFLVCSFFLFIYHKEIPAWIAATLGGFAKWFPFLALPCYLIFQQKNGVNKDRIIKEILITIIIASIVTIPFIIVNSQMFLKTYFFHLNRPSHVTSMVYYMDAISRQIFQFEIFSQVSLIIGLICGLFLFSWYYYRGGKDYLTLVYMVFFIVFTFVLTNKAFSPQYIVWITPFLAILLSNSLREIVLFYLVQLIFFLELPLLFDIIYSVDSTYSVFEHSQFSSCFLFFSLKFLILIITYIVIINNLKKHYQSNDRG